jgi:hypothetical protein
MYVKHIRVFTLENLLRCPIHYLFECLPARLMMYTVNPESAKKQFRKKTALFKDRQSQ